MQMAGKYIFFCPYGKTVKLFFLHSCMAGLTRLLQQCRRFCFSCRRACSAVLVGRSGVGLRCSPPFICGSKKFYI